VMSKLANPWKCDGPTCGIFRANDTNHWMIVRLIPTAIADVPRPTVRIEPWSDKLAGRKGMKHVCGIDCCLRITATLIAENFFPTEASSTGKEVADG
jgi:hypothetical protein